MAMASMAEDLLMASLPDTNKAQNINLLSNSTRVETPFIKVTIGDYTFGAYNRTSRLEADGNGAYILSKVQYPNYIQRLRVQKINGTVNKYTLELVYAVTQNDDPNFFEKVFSSVSKTRKVVFSYGDLSAPAYLYREEEALITKVTHDLDIRNCSLRYTVTAVGTGAKVSVGSHTFEATYEKPSKVIRDLLYSRPELGLLDVFYGMKDEGLVQQEGLILGDDIKVHLQKQTNMSALDYLSYLVSKMRTTAFPSLFNKEVYSLVFVDDTSGRFNGPYFKIVKVKKVVNMSTAYEIDIGFPSQNIVMDYKCTDDDTYSIYYDFSKQLQDSQYVQRINDDGEIEEVLAPVISSGNASRDITNTDTAWWTSVTEFPIRLQLTVKGLLRPAILMTHVRLNVYFYGRKFIDSGLYIITRQEDEVSPSGFRTVLSLTRVDGDR